MRTVQCSELYEYLHGDQSILDVIVRLSQSWKNMIPLIDNGGENYGNIKGDDAAAARYVKTRLSKYAIDCFFSDFNPDMIDMVYNYDESTTEPLFLPAKYPNVLINNASGMAFGVATNIPSYNVKELLEYTIKLINNPECKGYLIPDSPTDCLIVNDGDIFKEIHETGRGVFRMRGEMELDDEKGLIRITSIPFQVNFANIKDKILELREKKVINGLLSMDDDSGEDYIELSLRFKKEISLQEVSKLLYTKTSLENHYPVQIKVIDDLSIQQHSVRTLLLTWLKHRRDFKRRFYNMKIVQNKAREHIIDIILFISNKDNAEKTLKIMKKSEDKVEIAKRLMEEYDIDSLKAEAIANMRFHEFSKKSLKAFNKEKDDLVEEIKKYKKIVSDPSKVDQIIIEELQYGIKKYGVSRKSKIITVANGNEIPDTKHTLVFTKNGYVKKLKDKVGTVGFIGQQDEPIDIINVNNRDELMIFDSSGKVHNIPVSAIQGTELNSQGHSLDKYGRIENSKVISIFVKNDKYKEDETFLLFTTKNGLIKKTPYTSYLSLNNSVIATLVKNDDE